MIYYVATADMPVLALPIYAKNEQDDIRPEQRKVLQSIIADYKARRVAREDETR